MVATVDSSFFNQYSVWQELCILSTTWHCGTARRLQIPSDGFDSRLEPITFDIYTGWLLTRRAQAHCTVSLNYCWIFRAIQFENNLTYLWVACRNCWWLWQPEKFACKLQHLIQARILKIFSIWEVNAPIRSANMINWVFETVVPSVVSVVRNNCLVWE